MFFSKKEYRPILVSFQYSSRENAVSLIPPPTICRSRSQQDIHIAGRNLEPFEAVILPGIASRSRSPETTTRVPWDIHLPGVMKRRDANYIIGHTKELLRTPLSRQENLKTPSLLCTSGRVRYAFIKRSRIIKIFFDSLSTRDIENDVNCRVLALIIFLSYE